MKLKEIEVKKQSSIKLFPGCNSRRIRLSFKIKFNFIYKSHSKQLLYPSTAHKNRNNKNIQGRKIKQEYWKH